MRKKINIICHHNTKYLIINRNKIYDISISIQLKLEDNMISIELKLEDI